MENTRKLLEIMAALRNPETGCPWDLQQSFASVAPYTLEEAYEVIDAIEREDWPGLENELGDLLFQVVFHARLGEEQGDFDFESVAGAICDKLIRRHPHVFGDAAARSKGPTDASWERIKAEERAASGEGTQGALYGVAAALPALKRADKISRRAATVGFDWPEAQGARDKVDEELRELDAACSAGAPESIAEELGDLLLAVTNLARHLEVDAEQALRAANAKFEQRFRGMEADAARTGTSLNELDLQALEALWQAQKRGVSKDS